MNTRAPDGGDKLFFKDFFLNIHIWWVTRWGPLFREKSLPYEFNKQLSSNLVCACHIGVVQSIWLIIDLLKFEFRHIPFFIWIRYLNVKLLSTPWNVNIKLICQIYNLHPQAPFLSSKVDLNVLLPSCVIYPGLSLISFIPINRGEFV